MQINKVIFGAGNYGRKAFELLLKSNQNKEQIIFCDNFVMASEDYITGAKIICYEKLKEIYNIKRVSIIIATKYFMEIYEQCILDEIYIDGIYDLESNSIIPYKEFCKLKYTGYSNHAWIKYKWNKHKKVLLNADKFLKGEQLSNCITEVAIMISNLCNYSCIHQKCPTSLVKNKEIMSMARIKMIVSELKELEFKGAVCFHIYNEPMNDPRLFSILEYIKKEIPNVLTEVYTNGYYLNQTICDEMENGLVDLLIVTGYGVQEYERILNLDIHIPFYVLYGYLDNRLENYDLLENESKEICYSLLSQVPIYVNGDIGLCCLDYKHDSAFGNVFEQELKEILNSQKVRDFQAGLLKGIRNIYPLCTRCGWKIENI